MSAGDRCRQLHDHGRRGNRKQLLESAKSNFFGLNEEEVQIEFAPFEKFRGAKGAAYFLIREKFLNI